MVFIICKGDSGFVVRVGGVCLEFFEFYGRGKVWCVDGGVR